MAEILLEHKKYRQALLFGHLAVEKILKALVVKATEAVPPKIHNLRMLAEMVGFDVPDEVMAILREFDAYQIQGRYPGQALASLSPKMARDDMARIEPVRQWFRKQL